MIYSKLSLDTFCRTGRWSRFWEFGANHFESRLQLKHVPVHKTDSAKVRKIATTSKTPSLNRIVSLSPSFYTIVYTSSVLDYYDVMIETTELFTLFWKNLEAHHCFVHCFLTVL